MRVGARNNLRGEVSQPKFIDSTREDTKNAYKVYHLSLHFNQTWKRHTYLREFISSKYDEVLIV